MFTMKTVSQTAKNTLTSKRLERAFSLAQCADVIREPLPEGRQVLAVLKELNVDEDTLIAALLADRRLLDSLELVEIDKQFGETVAGLVNNVRSLNDFRNYDDETLPAPEQAERLRRLILAMVDDVRAVLIKIAYRLVRLELLGKETYEARRCIARETLDVYAPLANRLGIAQLKWKLEDLAFRYLDPQTYKKIATSLEGRRIEREAYIEAFEVRLQALMDDASITATITGRPKHIYSIWRKMQTKHLSLEELFDIRALRVVVAQVGDCYSTLGLIHTHWKTIPREFDDYIANPKSNGYQSLHTVVIGPQAKSIEIQIRTEAMHEFSELGFAAHWLYKEGSQQDQSLHKMVRSMRSLLTNNNSDTALIEDFKSEVFPNRIFVLTPKGDVVELPRGATSLDFAYGIHTEVGHRCRGAKVNGKIVPLTRKLKTGERVEILKGSHAAPSRDWMNPNSGYLASSNARAKVRYWFHQQNAEDNIESGRRMLEQTIKRLGVKSRPLEELLAHFRQPDENALMVAIGRGDIRQTQLDALFRPDLTPRRPANDIPRLSKESPDLAEKASVEGLDNLLIRIGNCCKPVPGDDVVGYITQGQGVTVHRRDCGNILSLSGSQQDRLLELQWGSESSQYSVDLKLTAFDRRGLLNDVTQIFTEEKANLLRADTRTDDKTQQVTMALRVQVKDYQQLTMLIDRIKQLKNMFEVRRVNG
jgi:GTP pyrophosphokinase